MLASTGKPAAAMAAYEQSVETLTRLADDNPAVTEFRSRLADSHNNIGILQSETGKPAEALASYGRALAIRQKLADANPAVTEFRSRLADSHNNIGVLQSQTGKPAEALAVVPAGAGDPAEAGRRQPRRHRLPQPTWRSATTTSASCSRRPASRPRRWSRTGRRWRSSRSWPTTTPPSPNSEAAWRTADEHRLALGAERKGSRGRR